MPSLPVALLLASAIAAPPDEEDRYKHCSELRRITQGRPLEPSPSISNVVFTLVRSEEDASGFIESSKCLSRALSGGPPFDRVIFHEGNLPKATARRIEQHFADVAHTHAKPRFVDAREFGAFAPNATGPHGLDARALGYRHMCHFMSMRWFHALATYEHAMRVDVDVCVQRFVHNPFEVMREQRLVYGYGLQTQERHAETLETMPPWVASYAAAAFGIAPNSSGALDIVEQIFFTNLFVSRVDWWLRCDVSSPACLLACGTPRTWPVLPMKQSSRILEPPSLAQVRRFLGALEDSNNIFLHRWGDAPIQTAALRLLAPPTAVQRLPTDYLHVSTMNRIFSDGHETDGWADPEMLLHPIVSAHRRLEATGFGSSNSTNCTRVNASVSCAAASAVVNQEQRVVILTFAVMESWSSFDEASLAAVGAAFAAFFSVDESAVHVEKRLSSNGVICVVQVRARRGHPRSIFGREACTSFFCLLTSNGSMSCCCILLLPSPFVCRLNPHRCTFLAKQRPVRHLIRPRRIRQ
jgi:hypothetical protein